MPSTTCPNCGNTDLDELRRHHFACNYCGSKFHSADAQDVTTFASSASCRCGRFAAGICTHCAAALCQDHQITWEFVLGSWQSLKRGYVSGHPQLLAAVEIQGGLAGCRLKRQPGWLVATEALFEIRGGIINLPIAWQICPEVTRPVLKQLRLDHHEPNDLLCFACVERLFSALLGPIERRIRLLEQRGRICATCTEKRQSGRGHPQLLPMGFIATGRCTHCGAAVCGAHYHQCTGCQKIWCRTHGRLSKTGLCRRCSSWKFFKRFVG